MGPSPGQVVAALNHPIRRRILRAVSGGEKTSPSELAETIDETLAGVSYHVRYLQTRKVFKRAGYRQVRGAREHFYCVDLGEHAGWASDALSATETEDARI